MTKYQLLISLNQASLDDLRALFGKDKDSISGEAGLYAQAPLADHIATVNQILRDHFKAKPQVSYHGQKNVGWDSVKGPLFFHTFKFPEPLSEALVQTIQAALHETSHTVRPIFVKLGGA